jgi:hypothetical protein
MVWEEEFLFMQAPFNVLSPPTELWQDNDSTDYNYADVDVRHY